MPEKKKVLWIVHPNEYYTDRLIRNYAADLLDDTQNLIWNARLGRDPRYEDKKAFLVSFKEGYKIEDPELKRKFVDALSDVLIASNLPDFDTTPQKAVKNLDKAYKEIGKEMPGYYKKILGTPEEKEPFSLEKAVFESICNNIAHAQKQGADVVIEFEPKERERFLEKINEYNRDKKEGEKINIGAIKLFTFYKIPELMQSHLESVERFLKKAGIEPKEVGDLEVHLAGFVRTDCVPARALGLRKIKELFGLPEEVKAPKVKIIGGLSTIGRLPKRIDESTPDRERLFEFVWKPEAGGEYGKRIREWLWRVFVANQTKSLRDVKRNFDKETFDKEFDILKKMGVFKEGAYPWVEHKQRNWKGLAEEHKDIFENAHEFRKSIEKKAAPKR